MLSMREQFVQMLSLPGPARLPIHRIARYIYMCGTEAEEERPYPLFVIKRRPELFAGQPRFLASMIDIQSRLSDLDSKQRKSVDRLGLGIDIVELITQAAENAGLNTSDKNDMRYTSLLILYSRHRSSPSFAAFYADCIMRVLEGRTTILRRYHEDRMPHHEQAWYEFAD
jgi:hypothetical protein